MNEEIPKARVVEAKNLAKSLLKKAGVINPPTSLGEIIRFLQKDHDLVVLSNNSLQEKMSGFLITIETDSLDDQGKRYDEIHFNDKHCWHRKRFTIAHEIGHLLFNTSCSKSFLSFDFVKDPIEVEANQFASELLIPFTSLKKDLKKPGIKIPELAFKYIVSNEAMGWKISSCNLLSKI